MLNVEIYSLAKMDMGFDVFFSSVRENYSGDTVSAWFKKERFFLSLAGKKRLVVEFLRSLAPVSPACEPKRGNSMERRFRIFLNDLWLQWLDFIFIINS